MSNVVNRWPEYRAGTLTPPAVVQVDTGDGGVLIWVWTGKRVRGPFNFPTWDAAREAAAKAKAMLEEPADPDTYTITCENGQILEGLIEDGDTTTSTAYSIDLTITPTAQQAAAWNLIKPVLAAHLKKVNRVYRVAATELKTEIRKNCPIFDAVVKLTEDEE